MSDIDARTVDGYTWVVGQTVRIGGGKHTWTIVSFFGDNYSYAELQRIDLASSRTSAHMTRLKVVAL